MTISNLMKIEENSPNRRKTLWEKEKLPLRASSPFPTVFSEDLFPRGVKRRHCVGKS